MGLKQLLIDSGDNFRQRLLTPDYTLPEGTNNAPLITKALPGVEEDPNTTKEFINNLTDGFVPGGGILAAERAFTDTQRITKFLLTGEGISFAAREAAIQRANPQTLISPTNRTRLPLNLLAQIPGNIAGVHVRRDGGLDTTFESNFNYSTNGDNSGGGLLGGFLANLLSGGKKYDKEIQSLIIGDNEIDSPHTLKNLYFIHKQGAGEGNVLKEYSGGANSFFGVGNTQITKYPSGKTRDVTFTLGKEQLENSPIPIPGSYLSKEEFRDYLVFGPQSRGDNAENPNSLLFNYKNFKAEGLPFSKEYKWNSSFNLRSDFSYRGDYQGSYSNPLTHRQYNEFTTNPVNSNTDLFEPRYQTFENIEGKGGNVRERIRTVGSKYQFGDPDKKLVNSEIDEASGYVFTVPNKNLTVDKLNEYWVHNESPSAITRNSFNYASEDLENLEDYIKFRIALVDTSNPLRDEVLTFRAFLENLNDNFNGSWNSFKYNGRAENFYTYNGFDREISFAFKIGAQSKEELKPLWKKLNYLVSSTAPEYVNRRMRGRFVRLTIGDWCYELPGFFPTVQLNWTTSFPWNLDEASNHFSNQFDTSQHPMILNVSCNFKPIHDFTPESKYDKPFIIRIPPTPQPAPAVDESSAGFDQEAVEAENAV